MKNIFYTWNDKEILITGGTGSLGKTITKLLKTKYKPKGIRIFSRDELKQWEFKKELQRLNLDDGVAFLLGDVRDKNRLDRAMNRVDLVYNTAAMKQVPACEENPVEAIKTNIEGAMNILDSSIDNKVDSVIHVSTDKAVYPVNLYGATKTVAEKLFLHGNAYSGKNGTKFSVCRYGNVLGSRGSIIPLFLEQAKTGTITITDFNMTRFWITMERVSNFIVQAGTEQLGNVIYIPKMPSVLIVNMAQAIAPKCKIKEIGIRKGEKLHECLIAEEESLLVDEDLDTFYIHPDRPSEEQGTLRWSYNSNLNQYLTPAATLKMIKPFMER